MHDSDPLRLRAAHASEAAEIASISRQHVEHGLRWRWTPGRIKRHVADPDSMVLVASRAGVMQGFAIMKFADDSAHLLLLAVQPKSRRRGIATDLLRWLEKSCVTAGIQQIRLELRDANQPARKFYTAMGYRLVGRMAAYYDRQESAVVMGKYLHETVFN